MKLIDWEQCLLGITENQHFKTGRDDKVEINDLKLLIGMLILDVLKPCS